MDHSSITRLVADTFLSKGYNGYFIATSFGSAYHFDCTEKIEAALSKYFLETVGKAKEDIKPLSLQTYLKWNGEDKEFVTGFMQLSFDQDKPMLLLMEIQKHYCAGSPDRTIKLTNLSLGAMPSAAEAIKMISTDLHNQPVVPKSKKFRL